MSVELFSSFDRVLQKIDECRIESERLSLFWKMFSPEFNTCLNDNFDIFYEMECEIRKEKQRHDKDHNVPILAVGYVQAVGGRIGEEGDEATLFLDMHGRGIQAVKSPIDDQDLWSYDGLQVVLDGWGDFSAGGELQHIRINRVLYSCSDTDRNCPSTGYFRGEK